MTVRIDKKEGLIRALALLAQDIEAGIVVSCSLHYEPTHVARLSICYVTGRGEDSELPSLPGVSVVDDGDDEPTATTKQL
jgi:hypothetical protein